MQGKAERKVYFRQKELLKSKKWEKRDSVKGWVDEIMWTKAKDMLVKPK